MEDPNLVFWGGGGGGLEDINLIPQFRQSASKMRFWITDRKMRPVNFLGRVHVCLIFGKAHPINIVFSAERT